MNKDEIKDQAARQMGYDSFRDYWDYQMKAHSWTEEVQFREHYAELHTASALDHFKQEAREKLPDMDNIEVRGINCGLRGEELTNYCYGAEWAINQVKELLK